jgi:hypothetical protein
LLARSVYVMVSAGETVRDPLAATGDPSRVTVVASVDSHVNVADSPRSIVSGVTVIVAVGIPADGGGGGVDPVTVTVALAVLVPAALVARSE